jgi:hypothetical protein
MDKVSVPSLQDTRPSAILQKYNKEYHYGHSGPESSPADSASAFPTARTGRLPNRPDAHFPSRNQGGYLVVEISHENSHYR